MLKKYVYKMSIERDTGEVLVSIEATDYILFLEKVGQVERMYNLPTQD